jgi:hypothetical protein
VLNARSDEARDNRPMKITVYRAEDGWRCHARSGNGEIVSESGEAYDGQVVRNRSSQDVRPERFGDRDRTISRLLVSFAEPGAIGPVLIPLDTDCNAR